MRRLAVTLVALLLLTGFVQWKPPADLQPQVNASGMCPDGRRIERVGFQRDVLSDRYDLVAYYLNGVPLMVFSGGNAEGRFTRFEVFLPDGKSEVFNTIEELAEKYPSPCDVVSPAPEKSA